MSTIPSGLTIPSNTNMEIFQTPAVKPFVYDNSSPQIDRSVTPDSPGSEDSPNFSLSGSQPNTVFTSFMETTTTTDAQLVSPSQEKVRELWEKKAKLLLGPEKPTASSLNNSSTHDRVRKNLAPIFEEAAKNHKPTLSNFSIKQITSFSSFSIQ